MSGVIYQFSCAKCKLGYIGSTKRYWEKRQEEHTHISARTGKPLNGMQIFPPLQHMRIKHPDSPIITRDDFKIITREQNSYTLQVKESVFINHIRPELNNNVVSVPLHLLI